MTEISTGAGLSESAVRMAFLYDTLPRADQAVAEFLDIPLHELWPDRYHPNGKRKPRLIHTPEPTKKPGRRHCQNVDAA